jgi:hypothetical protein
LSRIVVSAVWFCGSLLPPAPWPGPAPITMAENFTLRVSSSLLFFFCKADIRLAWSLFRFKICCKSNVVCVPLLLSSWLILEFLNSSKNRVVSLVWSAMSWNFCSYNSFASRYNFSRSSRSLIVSCKWYTFFSRFFWITPRSFILVACVLFWREIALKLFWVSFFVSFIWVFNCLVEFNYCCSDVFSPWRVCVKFD